MSYYNVPADPKPGSHYNPWRTLRAVASVDDFVVVKLDIDTPVVENRLIEQLLQDSSLCALIDELFYEEHAALNPIFYGHGLGKINLTLADTYSRLGALRAAGIRAHGWV